MFLLQDRPYNLNTVTKIVPFGTKCIMVKVNNLMSSIYIKQNYTNLANIANLSETIC